MPEKVTFILGIHNHQPVGNFEHVIEEAWDKAYRPFIEVMGRYPDIPFCLHCSGILWDWFADRHPEYIERVARMTAAGRLELMSGGYYEPILTVIPGGDRSGQLEMMRQFIAGRFGSAPRGCWLTERIWDPHLPETLARAGLEYVVVDDSHFKSTGFTTERMRGYFNTEENDFYIRVFPIDKRLRYLIPFHEPEEVIEYLREVSREPGGGRRIVVLADDGEKFGLWTGTHDLCYRQRWLERFCELLRSNSDWITVSTFSRVIDETLPRGIVYLPTASYSEMMEWALPLRAQESYRAAKDVLSRNGTVSDPAESLRGGFWRNFLVKYEESNWMHKRMLRASELVGRFEREGTDAAAAGEARRHLYQAQCNCAYWHGLFGGLYLPHLRSAVFTHLIAAESIARLSGAGSGAGPLVERGDLDGDGIEETVVATARLQAFFKARGGTLRELDLVGPRLNLTDTLTRREEIYHRDLVRLARGGGTSAGSAISIHDVASAKEEGLEKHLQYDRWPRVSLVDRFLEPGERLGRFAAAGESELGDFVDGLYEVSTVSDETATRVVLERTGVVAGEGGPVSVRLGKDISIPSDGASMTVRYRIRAEDAPVSCRFAVENVFSLLAGNAPDRYFEIPGRTLSGGSHLASLGEETGVETVRMVDEWLDIAVKIELEPVALLWRFPVETVSNSDSGFERVYQGSAVVPVWDLAIEAGEEAAFSIVFSFGSARD